MINLTKRKEHKLVKYIGWLFYLAGIPFNVARLEEFKWAVEAIGQYGPNMKPPSFHKLRVPSLLDQSKREPIKKASN